MAPAIPRPSPTLLLYAAVALALFFILGTHPNLHEDGGRRAHRRLKLRSNFSEESPARLAVRFDPMVADIEMRREDREWELSHYAMPLQHGEAEIEWREEEEYVNDVGRFNMSRRMEELFPMIDVEPPDGAVTLAELRAWFFSRAARDKDHRTKRGMELYDKNRDGFVSLAEFKQLGRTQQAHPDSNASDESHIYSEWFTDDHFHASDMDGDGRLNLTEFGDLFDPADSKNPKVLAWLCKQEMRHRDKDGDGKLNFEEFYLGLVDFLMAVNPDVSSQLEHTKSSGKELFNRLDLDNDRALNEKELEAVIGIFHPSEFFYADKQAEQAFKMADANNDGRLTLKEMIDNAYAFYTGAVTDHGDLVDLSHGEFR